MEFYFTHLSHFYYNLYCSYLDFHLIDKNFSLKIRQVYTYFPKNLLSALKPTYLQYVKKAQQ